MKVTRFFKLKRALEGLDVNYVANEIAFLEERLTRRGQGFDSENTAITHEGIYYIHPESGMAVRVALYDCENSQPIITELSGDEGFTDVRKLELLNEYHVMKCNTLLQAERNLWRGNYQVVQRLDDRFYYRYKIKNRRDQEVNNQKLLICKNCFMKVNSLLDGVQETPREEFEIKNFFDVEYFGSWTRFGDDYDAAESLANMYPKDWEEISRIRKDQVSYNCEGCGNDFSTGQAKRFLHVHPIDYVKRKMTYVKLQCLCIGCLTDYPERAHFKDHPDYERCMNYLAHGTEVLEKKPTPEEKKPNPYDSDRVIRRRF